MRHFGWSLFLVSVAACSSGKLEHEASVNFGVMAPGSQVTRTLALHNAGSAALTVRATMPIGDFAVTPSTLRLEAGARATLELTLSTTALGPATGVLNLATEDASAQVALSARVEGAQLSANTPVSFGTVPFVAGQAPEVARASLALRNLGTTTSMVRISDVHSNDAALCVGERCAGFSPVTLAGGQTLSVPLEWHASGEGPQRFTLTVTSDDPFHPEMTVEALAIAEPVSPCVLTATPTALVLVGDVGQLTLRHAGPGACVIRDVTVASNPTGRLHLVPPERPLPTHLEPGATLSLWVRHDALSMTNLTGSVRVDGVGAPPLEVPVSLSSLTLGSVVLNPSDLDFGVVPIGCGSLSRGISLYNLSAVPLTLTGVELVGASADFSLMNAPAANTVLTPGQAPLVLSVQYRPRVLGQTEAAVVVHTNEADLLIALRGKGDPAPFNTDTFANPPLARSETLVLVDASPSFLSRRPQVRANVEQLLRSQDRLCSDSRWSFAPAEGAPSAGLARLANDAGQTTFSSLDPDFVEQALAALDTLPVGSEVEACLGPASQLLGPADAGVARSVLCITDALDQTADAGGALARIAALGPPTTTWAAAVPTPSSTCTVEAPETFSWATFLANNHGASADICDPNWSSGWINFDAVGWNCVRAAYYLTAQPASELEIRSNGQLMPHFDANGTALWSYDPVLNAVRFAPVATPGPGARVEISYSTGCGP